MAYHFNGSNIPMTEKDEWRTNPALVDYLTDRFYINFDLFATDENAIVTSGHFTQRDDALSRDWPNDGFPYDGAWNFANPSFSLKEQAILKAIDQLNRRGVRTLMVLPLSPETKWFIKNLCEFYWPFHDGEWKPRFPIYTLTPRVAYLNKDGKVVDQPPFVTCLVKFDKVDYIPEMRWLKWK